MNDRYRPLTFIQNECLSELVTNGEVGYAPFRRRMSCR